MIKSDRTFAPWTDEQVETLNKFQALEFIHPFTCIEHSNLPLIATKSGWVCAKCDYTQGWAHAEMADPESLRRFKDDHDRTIGRLLKHNKST